jgi:GH24 family phage-related lysozyme (muramidase)
VANAPWDHYNCGCAKLREQVEAAARAGLWEIRQAVDCATRRAEEKARWKEFEDGAAAFIKSAVKVSLTQDEHDELVGFIYRVGEGDLEMSGILNLLNEGNFAAAADEFEGWTNARGGDLARLLRQRHAAVNQVRQVVNLEHPNVSVNDLENDPMLSGGVGGQP